MHTDGKDHEESIVAVVRVCGREVKLSSGASEKRSNKAPLALFKLYVIRIPPEVYVFDERDSWQQRSEIISLLRIDVRFRRSWEKHAEVAHCWSPWWA